MTWRPLVRAVPRVHPAVRERARTDPRIRRALDETREIWRNDEYVVIVHRDPGTSHPTVLSIRRDDRQAVHDWRDFQRIKDQLAGEETEAVELYPARSRLVDSANQYWLWYLPPGVRIPFGFTEQAISDSDAALFPGAVQRPLDA